MMVDRLLKSTPDGKLTVFKSGIFGEQNVWPSELWCNCTTRIWSKAI